jgi:hypothetical protein
MKARWKILIAAGVFLAVFIGIWLVTIHVGPENEVEAYKKLLREKGEKLEISEVLPPPVPPESNGASVAQSAFALFSPLSDEWTNLPSAMRMIAPGKAMVGWAQSEVRASDFTNSWENVTAAAEDDQPARKLLQQSANYPAFDFQLDYNKGPEMLLKHLALLKRSAQRLSAAAMCDLHNGDTGSATTNLCTLLALVRGEDDERTIISQLVRIAMAGIAAAANWELLQSTNATDAQLAMLQKSWGQLEFVKGTENSFLMERAMNEATIQKMRASNMEFHRLMGMYSSAGISGPSGAAGSGNWLDDVEDSAKEAFQNAKFAGATFMWRTSWTYSDELNALKNDQDILETLRLIETNHVFQPAYNNLMSRLYPSGLSRLYSSSGAARIYDAVWDGLDDMNLRQLFSGSAGSLASAIRRTMAAEGSKRVVITAIALKRFQLKHGNFPEKISDLAPEFLAAVPLDPVDGKPLRYHANPDGTFLLYSVGENGVDDGGDATPAMPVPSSTWQWQRVRDWVWPQPATPTEVQFFYDHPPK